MDKPGKKAVRFSSPFDVSDGQFSSNPSFMKSTDSLFKSKGSRDTSRVSEKGGGDSWDAFDAKMGTSKRIVKDTQKSKFMELSSSQNKSLNIAEEEFSVLSFKDANDLIAKDEVERMQFQNSNASFSNGLDEMEAPSLLSVTSYFQQGSSFPVPYICNDSTMFGSSQIEGLPKFINSSSSRSNLRKDSLGKSDASMAPAPLDISEFIGLATKEAVDRKDSLANFFLGSQSDGLNKTDIMDYVLDYCKRRASLRLSDASENMSSNSSNEKSPGCNDSGLGFGTLERGRRSSHSSNVNISRNSDARLARPDTSLKVLNVTTKTNEWGKDDPSILMSDGTSQKGNASMDMSDVGFEKFKKELNVPRRVSENRFRSKQIKHEEFERKRITVDEKNSYPGVSSLPYKEAAEVIEVEKQNKVRACSPPEKLVERPRFEKIVDKTPTTSLLESQSNQFHSTPVNLLCDTSAPKLPSSQRSNDSGLLKSSKGDKVDGRLDKMVRQKLYKKSKDSSSNSSFVSDTSVRSGKQTDQRRESKRTNPSDKHRSKLGETKRSKSNASSVVEDSPRKVVETATQYTPPMPAAVSEVLTAVTRPNFLPESLNVMPVIHTGAPSLPTTVSTPACTPSACTHQCGQHTNPHGLQGGVGMGLPIVIHIHLPSWGTQGAGVTGLPNCSSTDGTQK